MNTHTPLNQTLSSVVADASGNFVATWTSFMQDGSSDGVFGQRYASSGAPLGPEFRVNSYTTSRQFYSSVAADASGNFVVVWMSAAQDGSNYGIFGQRYAGSGAPLGPEFRVNTYTTNSQQWPQAASDGLGNFVVAWISNTQDGSGFGIFGQRYGSSGAPVGAEFQVNTYTFSQQYIPTVASDASGNLVVVWSSVPQDGSGAGVFGQRYASSGAPLGSEFRVNTYTLGKQRCSAPPSPCVTADAAGNFVVIWESSPSQDGSGYGVFGQRYASSGAPSGAEFRVNTYTTNDQMRPAVAADALGNFVVIWTSYGQDGSISGVFGQRYSQIVPVELMHFGVE